MLDVPITFIVKLTNKDKQLMDSKLTFIKTEFIFVCIHFHGISRIISEYYNNRLANGFRSFLLF